MMHSQKAPSLIRRPGSAPTLQSSVCQDSVQDYFLHSEVGLGSRLLSTLPFLDSWVCAMRDHTQDPKQLPSLTPVWRKVLQNASGSLALQVFGVDWKTVTMSLLYYRFSAWLSKRQPPDMPPAFRNKISFGQGHDHFCCCLQAMTAKASSVPRPPQT